ncbi:phosphopantothenoylcysteine decarboxylase, partial [Burkholderia multivorans]
HTAHEYAVEKFRRKGADLLVFNDVSADRAFGHDVTEVVVLAADGDEVVDAARLAGTKDDVAQKVTAVIAERLTPVESTP